MQVLCDVEKCTGLGLCESIAPDFFEVQDDGTLVMLRETFDESERTALNEAIRSCPTEALSLRG
ncbi:MAG: ferredoxin [Actinomycetota bacterium]|nr:ferredoxin [Actinomycetota bacterium]